MSVPHLTAAVFAASLVVGSLPGLPASDFAQNQMSDAEWCENAGSGDDRERFCEVRELTAIASSLTITDSLNGSVEVSGTSRNDLRVRARVVATAGTLDDARALAREVSVSLGADGRVRTDGPRTNGRRSWWVSYRAEVPTGTDLSLDTSNGSITVTGVRGRITAETANGSLRLTDLAGDVRARSSNGSVHVALSGTSWDGAGLDVQTSNGSARLDIPDGYSARLVTGTRNGSMRFDIPLTVQGEIRRQLDTTLGSGGATIRVQTSNGSLRIGRR